MDPRVPEVRYSDPLQQFRELMPRRVKRLLLAGSRYDFFLLWEDGQRSEFILSEWLHLHLSSTSWITHVTSGADAVAAAANGSFDLAVVTSHLADDSPVELGLRLLERQPDLVVVPLAFDDAELRRLQQHPQAERLERPYLWQGDYRLLLGVVQSVEDRWNAAPDTASVGVSVILVIEDSVEYYSMYLPLLYHEVNQQSESVLAEGTHLHHKIMRLRARPRILHCVTYDEARAWFDQQRPHLLGVITDVRFPRAGADARFAGLEFARMVREAEPDVPLLIQTREVDVDALAGELNARVLRKDSGTLLDDVRRFLREAFGFGPFRFLDEAGREIARAADLRDLEECLRHVPAEAIRRHARKNHFSTWLRARTEFDLAETLRAIDADEFASGEEIRAFLLRSLADFRRGRRLGQVTPYATATFDPDDSFARIGDGSLGGKARGLAFLRSQLENYQVTRRFANLRVHVPAAVVLATDVFDAFVGDNGLRDFALREEDDGAIERRFIAARLPDGAWRQLVDFVDRVPGPLAVRSSSLLEDSQRFALSGVYRTYMVPNNHVDRAVRVKQLMTAVKRVWAATYFQSVKDCFQGTPHVLEEEKMAVIVQRLVGRAHGGRFYPDFAGVARSHNYYPSGPMAADDGIARVALGLGDAVVRGEAGVSFCPRYPHHPVQSAAADAIEQSQVRFYALELPEPGAAADPLAEPRLAGFDLQAARVDGTLRHVGSTWSVDDERLYDGIDRPGLPLVTFAPLLQRADFPFAHVLQVLLEVGREAMNLPVEIEFACTLPADGDAGGEFALLQLRPFAVDRTPVHLDLAALDRSQVLCTSTRALGNGRRDDVRDLVVVDRGAFDRARSGEAARGIAALNAQLSRAGAPYLLIVPGRLGSADPWLGIPVQWPAISGVAAVVECDFTDLAIAASQGSHFFQNIASANVAYLSVAGGTQGGVDWQWLRERMAEQAAQVGSEGVLVRHLRLERGLTLIVDGRRGHGVVLKP